MHTVNDIPAAFRFGCCELKPHHRELRVAGKAVHLGGRAFDLLMVLVEGRGRLVSKDEIFERVWPGVIVEENTLQVQISALRKAMGGDRDALKTISGRGYRFMAEVTTSTEETEISRVLELVGAAVELAAACLPAPGVEELARRLDDRLRPLRGGGRTAAIA